MLNFKASLSPAFKQPHTSSTDNFVYQANFVGQNVGVVVYKLDKPDFTLDTFVFALVITISNN